MPNIPINQVVAFLKPYLNMAASALAAWLLVHVHALGLFHITQDKLAGWVVAGVIFVVTFLAQEAKDHHWLKGWRAFEALNRERAFWGEPQSSDGGQQVKTAAPVDDDLKGVTEDPPYRPEPGPDEPSPMGNDVP
jgi:hypothetical protein